MLTPRRLLRRLRALLSPNRLDRDLDDEIRFHLEMDAEAARRRGASPSPGPASLGNVPLVKDQVRDTRGVRPVEDFLTDVRVAVRGLARRPTFTIASLLTFALGAGGVAAVFGAINGILLAPLPYHEPERMVMAWEWSNSNSQQQEASPGNFLDWRERSTAFEYLVASEPYGLDWQSPDGPVYLPTWLVTERFFEAFGVKPLLGRTFRDDEHQQGRGQVIILGWAKWQRQFGGDPNVVGRIITLDGAPWEVIGVMPRSFDALEGNDLVWAPKFLAGWEPTARTSPFWTVVGRIRPGISIEQAGADLARVASQLGAEYPRTNATIGTVLVPLTEQVVGGARRALWLLLGAVGVLLVVAAANVTGLQLARALDRGREFAVRAAIGATGTRMVRQLVTETLVLAGLGSMLGFLLAVAGLGIVRRLAPPEVPRPEQLQANLPVLAVAIAVGLLTALVSGLTPALRAARSDPAHGLTEGGRAFTAGPLARRFRSVLVGGQFAFALVLLVGAGLLLRSFVALLNQDRGFQSDRVMVMVTQAWDYFPTPEARAEYVRLAIERLREVPGMEAAGMTSSIPLGENYRRGNRPRRDIGRGDRCGAAPRSARGDRDRRLLRSAPVSRCAGGRAFAAGRSRWHRTGRRSSTTPSFGDFFRAKPAGAAHYPRHFARAADGAGDHRCRGGRTPARRCTRKRDRQSTCRTRRHPPGPRALSSVRGMIRSGDGIGAAGLRGTQCLDAAQ